MYTSELIDGKPTVLKNGVVDKEETAQVNWWADAQQRCDYLNEQIKQVVISNDAIDKLKVRK